MRYRRRRPQTDDKRQILPKSRPNGRPKKSYRHLYRLHVKYFGGLDYDFVFRFKY